MKSQTTFEIKIAFCGYVNSGKSTLVNALLQQKYSEVSMNRSTYGVNAFRIFSSKDKSNNDLEEFETMSSKSTEESEIAWSVVPENVQSASQTHLAIATKNAELRGTDKIEESSFDIEVQEAICDMRKDTQLVVVDLPGFRSVTSDDLYVNYLNAKWDTFDSVVVVLDLMESASKQVQFFNLINKNLKEKKDIPVIFVCNKADNPGNCEVGVLLKELETSISDIFAKSVFFTMSAEDAMVYRATSGVSYEKFQQFDKAWIDKIGIDEVGRLKWRQLSENEKFDAAYKVISDKAVIQDILAATSFPKFHAALTEAVGGSSVQLELIQKQLEVALMAVRTFDDTTVTMINKIKCISEHLGIATEMSFNEHFWTTYKKYLAAATEAYKVNTDHKVFHLAMQQLIAYYDELKETPANETERRKIVDEMVSLVRVQFLELLQFADSWQTRYLSNKEKIDIFVYQINAQWRVVYHDGTPITQTYDSRYGQYVQPPSYNYDDAHHWQRIGTEAWQNIYTKEEKTLKYNPVSNKQDWYDLSMRDFEIAFASILLLSSCKLFCTHFGREKIRMDSLLRKFDCLRESFIENPSASKYHCMFQAIAGSYNDAGDFVPTCLDRYKVFVHFKSIPNQISDPEHWGFLAWKFCEFMEEKAASK